MNRACFTKNTNLHEQNQHASSIRPLKNNFVRMKKVIYLSILLLLSSTIVNTQTNQLIKNPAGKWLFEAPYAPEAYRAGTIEIVFTGSKYHATMAFAKNVNIFPGGNVKFANDTLLFNVFIDNTDVAISLSLTEETKMIGKAVYSDNIVPLTLTREMKK
jgi:hypothetical protein